MEFVTVEDESNTFFRNAGKY